MTVPAPQPAGLLGDSRSLHPQITSVVTAPCWTLMAGFSAEALRPFRARAAAYQPLAWIAQDNSKPGRSGTLTTWVAQASADWSEQYLEDTPEVVAGLMLPMLAGRHRYRAGRGAMRCCPPLALCPHHDAAWRAFPRQRQRHIVRRRRLVP